MPRPLDSAVFSLAPLAAVLLLACAHAPAADLPNGSAGDRALIVVTAERQDALSAAQATAIRSFNRDAMDVLAIEENERGDFELIGESSL